MGGMTTKGRRTAGMTTTGTREQEDIRFVKINGEMVEVAPKPLMIRNEPDDKKQKMTNVNVGDMS